MSARRFALLADTCIAPTSSVRLRELAVLVGSVYAFMEETGKRRACSRPWVGRGTIPQAARMRRRSAKARRGRGAAISRLRCEPAALAQERTRALTEPFCMLQAATPVATEGSYYKACAGAAEASTTVATVAPKSK